jgi:hypothetical protein
VHIGDDLLDAFVVDRVRMPLGNTNGVAGLAQMAHDPTA